MHRSIRLALALSVVACGGPGDAPPVPDDEPWSPGDTDLLVSSNPETYYRSATYSPDGAWIAFGVGRDEAADIRLMRADGSGVRTVLEGGRDFYPRFSPDGRWLVVCSARNEEQTDLDVRAVPVDTGAAAADPPPPVWLATGPDRECEGSWRPPTAPAFRP